MRKKEKRKKKDILLSWVSVIFVVLMLIGIVAAASLNIGTHTQVDFGTMSPREQKTMGYYVKGFYEENGIDYSVCVKHPIEGEMKKWIRLNLDETSNLNILPSQECDVHKKKMNEHWVGPERDVTWIKNVHIKLRIPPRTLPGEYTTIINNIGCFQSSFGIRVCNSVPTTIKVIVK